MILPDLVFANGLRLVPIANMEAVMWFSRYPGCCVYGKVFPKQKDNQTHFCPMRQSNTVCVYVHVYTCMFCVYKEVLLAVHGQQDCHIVCSSVVHNLHACVCAYVCTYVDLYVHMYMHMYVRMCTCAEPLDQEVELRDMMSHIAFTWPSRVINCQHSCE